MIERFFHAWERRLAAATTNRVVRPFEWGADWLDDPGDPSADPAGRLERAAAAALADPDWFASAPCPGYALEGDRLTFPSQIETPHAANNTVHARYFPAASGDRRRAVLVLPQWNADAEGHVGLCRFLARVGISALRLTLPYHDARMPPELERADYIVSANVGRTLQVNRQAVLDARRAVAWLDARGHERIGILGSSLGSCLASLTAAHEPRITAAALNHVSPYFADVVWDGLSTEHVRAGLDGAIELDRLRRLWLPISPLPYVDRLRGTRVLLVYARYDLTFPVHLSRRFVAELRRCGLTPRVFALPCGHYTTGEAPFKWLDGYVLIQFLRRNLAG